MLWQSSRAASAPAPCRSSELLHISSGSSSTCTWTHTLCWKQTLLARFWLAISSSHCSCCFLLLHSCSSPPSKKEKDLMFDTKKKKKKSLYHSRSLWPYHHKAVLGKKRAASSQQSSVTSERTKTFPPSYHLCQHVARVSKTGKQSPHTVRPRCVSDLQK